MRELAQGHAGDQHQGCDFSPGVPELFFINERLVVLLLILRERFVGPLFTCSLVGSRVCPGQGSNPRPWDIGLTLSPTKLPGQAKVLNS